MGDPRGLEGGFFRGFPVLSWDGWRVSQKGLNVSQVGLDGSLGGFMGFPGGL